MKNLFVRRKVIKRNGFKLIDILVVIVIIVLFVGLLIPALSRVREFAIRAECKTSLKGLHSACVFYSGDSVGFGDYTEDREKLFAGYSVDEICADIEEGRRKQGA